jgi:hypothetical protein
MSNSLQTKVRIKTPQHKDGKVFDWTVQDGFIDRQTWVFHPLEHISGSVGMHKVWFRSEDDFKKCQTL